MTTEKLRKGNVFSHVCPSVSQSFCPCGKGGGHVTITHDALDLNIKPPARDIWWPRLDTCSSLFTWGSHCTAPPLSFHLVASWRPVRILLECFFVLTRYYCPQRSCEGYVFTPVCLSTGRGEYLGRYTPGQVPPWDQVPPWTRYTPWDQVHPRAGKPPRDQVPPADGYCCGRYASYWNAFLLKR